MEPSIDRAHQAGEGRQVHRRGLRPVLDDEAQGLGARAARHVRRRRCRPTSWPRSRRRRRTSCAGKFTVKVDDSQPKSTASERRAHGRRRLPVLRLARHHQALRRAGRQRRHLARARRRRGAGAARRERRRQVDADVDPVRPLRRRRRAASRSSARPLPPGNPKAALAAGIGMVHQHFTLADNLSVLDNVMLGTEPLWQPFSRRARSARAGCCDVAQRFGLPVRARRARRQPVGRRAAAGRDPEGAVPRRAHPDPRRADRRADAAGERGAVRTRWRRWWRRACRSSSSATSSARCCACRTASRCCAAASWWPRRRAADTTQAQLAQWMVGHAVAAPVRRPAAQRRRRGLRARARAAPPAARATGCDDVSLHAARGEIVGRRRRLGQRPGGAGRAAVRHARARAPARCELDGRAPCRAAPARLVAARRRAHPGRPPRGRRGRRPAGVGERGLRAPAQPAPSRAGSWCGAARARRHARTRRRAPSTCAAAGSIAPARSLSGGNMQKLILGRALLRAGRADGRDAAADRRPPADLGPRHRRRRLRAAAADRRARRRRGGAADLRRPRRGADARRPHRRHARAAGSATPRAGGDWTREASAWRWPARHADAHAA